MRTGGSRVKKPDFARGASRFKLNSYIYAARSIGVRSPEFESRRPTNPSTLTAPALAAVLALGQFVADFLA